MVNFEEMKQSEEEMFKMKQAMSQRDLKIDELEKQLASIQ